MEKVENLGELIEAQTHLWNAMFHFKKSACLKCAVELGIPDVIRNHGKPITLSDLISVLPIHPSKSARIFRLMRFLANSGFFVENPQGYALTSAGRLLLKDAIQCLTTLADVGGGTGKVARALPKTFLT
nr:trans-resveratrol di-O-methyltransferase-like [Coffea arabica]